MAIIRRKNQENIKRQGSQLASNLNTLFLVLCVKTVGKSYAIFLQFFIKTLELGFYYPCIKSRYIIMIKNDKQRANRLIVFKNQT